MKLTWFGHSCFRVETARSVILIDPFLKGNPVFEGSGVSFEAATAGVTHVALTHGHDDHIGSAADICKANDATVVAVFELAMHIGGQGVEKVEPTNTGGTISAGDVEISFVNALHSASSEGVYLGSPCGLVLRAAGEKTLYHMGDTDIFGDMALINEIYAPKIGLVPIGDRFTMGAKTAALACKKFFDFETVVPCHYGTFPIIDQSADAFVSEMNGQNVVVPGVGEALDL